MYHGKNSSFLLFSNSDKQTTKLHFGYASHVAFRYKTDCETRIKLATNSESWLYYGSLVLGRNRQYSSLNTITCEPRPFSIRFFIQAQKSYIICMLEFSFRAIQRCICNFTGPLILHLVSLG